MATQTTVLYLHGIGGPDRTDKWLMALNYALDRQGLGPIRAADGVQVLTPSYMHRLKAGAPANGPAAPPPNSREVTTAERAAYLRRRAKLARGLKPYSTRKPATAARDVADMKEVQRSLLLKGDWKYIKEYAATDSLRRAIMADLLDGLPTEGELVIIGHSLGSVVAADLLRRLPDGLQVPLMLTLGSPLGLDLFTRVRRLTYAPTYPLNRLGVWLNLYDSSDFVTFGQTASRGHGPALDLHVTTGRAEHWTGLLGVGEHDDGAYLSQGAAAHAVGAMLPDLTRPSRHAPAGTTPMEGPAMAVLTPLLFRLAWLHARADQCRKDHDNRRAERVELCIETLASAWEERLAGQSPLIAWPDLRKDPSHLLKGTTTRDLVVWLTLLSLDHAEAPFYCGDPGERARDAIRRAVWKSIAGNARGAAEASTAIGTATYQSRKAISDSSISLERTVPALAGVLLILPPADGEPAAAGEAMLLRLVAGFAQGGTPGGLTVLARISGIPPREGAPGDCEATRKAVLDLASDLEPRALRGMLIALAAATQALKALKLSARSDALAFADSLEERCARDLVLHRKRDTDSGITFDYAKQRASAARYGLARLEAVSVDS